MGYSLFNLGFGERGSDQVEKVALSFLAATNFNDGIFISYLCGTMGQLEIFTDKLFSRHRWAIHLIFWSLVFLFYSVFFGRKNENYEQTFFFVGLLMPVTIGTTYFLNYFLVPRYLLAERYGKFILYFIYTLIASVYLEMIISYLTFILIAQLQIHSMSPASIDIFFLLSSLLVVVFLGVAIKLLLHWRKGKEDYQKLMRDKVEAELRFLKMQLNPHFLFNTLNNLYYLASEKSDKTPQAILALGELLDYVLHETKVEFVPLEKEIQQLKNYVALESLRYEDRLTVELKTSGNLAAHKMVPMLLITLADNAFKHGVMPAVGRAWIEISIVCGDRVQISVKNSLGGQTKNNSKGIGLENLRSQLNLLYPSHHSFETSATENMFQVSVMLP
jgi:sensor histidine kinase YesM